MKKQDSFKQLGVSKEIVKGLEEMGIVNPSPIQAQSIPLLIKENVDLVAQAATGTGKTAAFSIPLIERINPNKKSVQGLILVPTRELGQQIAKQIFKFTKYTDRIFTECVYGGERIEKQIPRLRRTTHIIVATPGRLEELIRLKHVNLNDVQYVVLDEADEMLSLGFREHLDKILTYVTQPKGKWLFSATLSSGVMKIVNKHMRENAVSIKLSPKQAVNKNVKHQFVVCYDNEKLRVLMQFLNAQGEDAGVVFTRTKAAAKELEEKLKSKKFSCAAIHGDLLQKERNQVMRAFKSGKLKMLIATDLAARGIDVPDLTYVAHYELPDKEEYYTHRSGRTGRAGAKGVSMAFVTKKELKSLRFFEKKLNLAFSQVR